MIILDTNIWYDISEGKIDVSHLNKSEICLTSLVLLEIMSSRHWYSRESYMLNVLETIRSIEPFYIPHLPLDYIADRVFDNKTKIKKMDYGCIEASLNGCYSINERNKMIITRNHMTDIFIKDFKNSISRIKDNNDLLNKLKIFDSFIYYILNDITSEVEKHFNIERGFFTESSINLLLENLDCYILVRYNYCLKSTLGSIKPKENDFIDLMNLIYVGNNDTYWSRDQKWTQRYMSTPKDLEKFLFKPS